MEGRVVMELRLSDYVLACIGEREELSKSQGKALSQDELNHLSDTANQPVSVSLI